MSLHYFVKCGPLSSDWSPTCITQNDWKCVNSTVTSATCAKLLSYSKLRNNTHCKPRNKNIQLNTHTHTPVERPFVRDYPGKPVPERKNQSGFYWSKRQWVAVGSDIHWVLCKSAPSSSQITTPAPHHSVFTGRMPFLPPNQQHQSTEGTTFSLSYV